MSVIQIQLERRMCCTRGHEWTEPAWGFTAFTFRNAENKRVCPVCLREWFSANMGTAEEVRESLRGPSHGETFTVPTEAKVEPLDEIPVEFTDGRAVFQNRPLAPTPGESPFVVLEPRELPDAPDEPAVVEGRPDA